MSHHRVVLASASPRRLDLLRQVGIAPTVRPQAVDESHRSGEAPDRLVTRLARLKGESAARAARAEDLVVAADTAVVLDRTILGKPQSAEHALEMLLRLRGRTHRVLTGVFLRRVGLDRTSLAMDTTWVRFGDFDVDLARDYVATGEPLGKAGGYAIQGRAAIFVERIEGSYPNVVDFPLERLPGWLRPLGLSLAEIVDWGSTPA